MENLKAIDLVQEMHDISDKCIDHVSAANYQSRTDEAKKWLRDKTDELWMRANKLDEINKDLLEALQKSNEMLEDILQSKIIKSEKSSNIDILINQVSNNKKAIEKALK